MLQITKVSLILFAVVLTTTLVACQKASVLPQELTSPLLENQRQFQLKFTHIIENTGNSTVHRQDLWVLVPQDNLNQTILNITFNPQPTEFLTDNWGQQIAHYVINEMAGNSRLEIGWLAEIQLSDISFQIDPDTMLNLSDIPADIIKTYTTDDVKYDLSSPIIKQAAKEAVGTNSGLYWKVKNIYDYVIDHLSYSKKGGWDDAATVLTRGDGSCSEYAFVLIALCRANGIPARYVAGSRLKADIDYVDNVFHRTVEVYLPGYGWVPLDPDLADVNNDEAAYFLRRYNSYFIMATAGGESDMLSWGYNSHLKVDNKNESTQVVSTRYVYWKTIKYTSSK